MKFIHLTVSAIAATLVAAPAFAQGEASALRGRIEARLGVDNPGAKFTFDDGFDRITGDGDDSGFNYGVEGGIDWDVGQGFIGAYGGVEFSDTKSCLTDGIEEACMEAKRNFTLGLRGGVKVGSGTRLFAKGGYSNGRVKAWYDDGIDRYEIADSRGGWHAGAGIEFDLRPAYVKLEYVYSDYKNYEADLDEDGFLDTALGFDRHQFIGGVGVRF